MATASPSPTTDTFGDRLLMARRLLGRKLGRRVPLREMAQRTSLPVSTLSSYETGESEPRNATIPALCRGYEVTPNYLYGWPNQRTGSTIDDSDSPGEFKAHRSHLRAVPTRHRSDKTPASAQLPLLASLGGGDNGRDSSARPGTEKVSEPAGRMASVAKLAPRGLKRSRHAEELR